MQDSKKEIPDQPGDGRQIRFLEISDEPRIELRITSFPPPAQNNHPAVVFVPGLASVMENFTGTLEELRKYFRVHYLETREKSSSKIKGRVSFNVPDLSYDIARAVSYMNFREGEYMIMGYSLGATAILESLPLMETTPAGVILAEPGASFPFPRWLLFLAKYAWPLYRPIKPFLKWYLRTFRVDMEHDRELYEINGRILDKTDPRKISRVVRHIAPYRFRPGGQYNLPPILVVGASKDKFHSFDDSREIADSLPGSSYLDMETNERTHGPEIVHEILKFLPSSGKKGLQ